VLVAWADRFCVLDAVKGLIPDVDRLVEYNKTRRAGLGLPLLLPYVELQQ
jgi:glutathione S-transferase